MSRRTAMALAAGLLLAPAAAHAGSLEVSPVALELPAGTGSTVLTVTNRGPGRVAVQVRGFRWSQTAIEDPLAPAPALLASPPIFELAPNEAQTVRVLVREPARNAEASYRLILDELPAPGASSTVRFALRVSLPLFVAPPTPGAPDLRWRVDAAPGGRLSLVARNEGTRRDKLAEGVVALPGVGQLRPQPLANAWILPGAERRWALAPAHGDPRGAANARLTARLESGAFDAPIPVQRAP